MMMPLHLSPVNQIKGANISGKIPTEVEETTESSSLPNLSPNKTDKLPSSLHSSHGQAWSSSLDPSTSLRKQIVANKYASKQPLNVLPTIISKTESEASTFTEPSIQTRRHRSLISEPSSPQMLLYNDSIERARLHAIQAVMTVDSSLSPRLVSPTVIHTRHTVDLPPISHAPNTILHLGSSLVSAAISCWQWQWWCNS